MILVAKVEKARLLIQSTLTSKNKKITLQKLQEICGFLNFLSRCIVPERAFTRRLYSYMTNFEGKLKPYHHIKIMTEMMNNLKMWLTFVNHQSIYAREFMLTASKIEMTSDASRSEKLGYGAMCGTSWMYSQWPDNFIKTYKPSIEYLELFALVGGVVNWIHRFKNRRVVLFCDNQSVVHMVNNTTSSCKNCMYLIRVLVLKGLTENVRIFAKYIPSSENTASDHLSRLKLEAFKKLRSDWDDHPTKISEMLWPIEKIWLK